MTGTTAGAAYNTSNWDAGTSLASAQAAGKYIYFTITNDAATELVINSVTLQSQVSATGPANVQMQYDLGAGDVNFGAMQTGFATATPIVFNFTGTTVHLCAGKTVTFKVYGWNAGTAAGTLRINDNSAVNAGFFNAISAGATATPNPVCSGQPLTLAGSFTGGSAGGHTYSWTGPVTVPFSGFQTTGWSAAAGGVPTGASGTYTFTVTDSWGCKASATTVLTVNPTPSAAITPTGTYPMCAFDSVVLTASTTTGVTYQWDTGAYVLPYSTYRIPGATNGTYTAHWGARYRVTVTSAAGCVALTTPPTTVTIRATAPATVTASGSLSFCTGGSVTLTAASGGGYTYQWYDGGVPIAGATNAAYTATTSGTLSVHVTTTAGCITQSATYTVVEVTLPTIYTTDTTAFCAGGAAVLRVNITSAATGVQYQWKRNSVNIVGATSNTYAATNTGDYTCFINIPGSCTITTNDINVLVHPTPTPAVTFNPTTNKFTTYNYYARYQWYINTVTIPGATTKTVTAYNNGSYRVMVTDTFGCVKLSDPYGMYNLSVNNVGGKGEIRLYPNPATDIVHIESAVDVKFAVSSMEGRVVLGNSSGKDINLAGLPNGLYLITVYDTDGNRLLVEKVIKQ